MGTVVHDLQANLDLRRIEVDPRRRLREGGAQGPVDVAGPEVVRPRPPRLDGEGSPGHPLTVDVGRRGHQVVQPLEGEGSHLGHRVEPEDPREDVAGTVGIAGLHEEAAPPRLDLAPNVGSPERAPRVSAEDPDESAAGSGRLDPDLAGGLQHEPSHGSIVEDAQT